jgi:indolepyruvate ferredoxin oxidoreductase
MPVETPFGRKRQIDQSACNIDLSCLEGFCPSFVTIEGGELRRAGADDDLPAPPPPTIPVLTEPHNLLIVGIGGTGVITISAILGMAAHLVGAGCSVLDNTGIARKGGAVTSDVRLAPRPADINVARIADHSADVLLACDPVTAATAAVLAKIARGRTRVIANAIAVPTLNQRLALDGQLDSGQLQAALIDVAGREHVEMIDSTAVAERTLGDAIYSNMVMLGSAFQKGLVPLPLEAIERAIELNGTDVEANRRAFVWGRHAAHAPSAIAQLLQPSSDERVETNLDELIAHRVRHLTDYQDTAYAERYRALVERVRHADRRGGRGDGPLAWAVARSYFRLLAIKDEYEVARLYSNGGFARALQRQFSGAYKIKYHLAPPLLARPDPTTGRIRKQTYGAWMGKLFRILARLKRLRGTVLDPFGHTHERKMERGLIAEYETTIDAVLNELDRDNYDIAVEIAALPESMRGYGYIKAANVMRAREREAQLLATFAAKAPRAA